MSLNFDNFCLDFAKAQLFENGREIPLEPKAFNLLCLLVRNSERVVGKEELIEEIWNGRFTSDSSITTVVKVLRQALDDDGTQQKYIRTIRGRGFRFVGDLGNSSVDIIESPDQLTPTLLNEQAEPEEIRGRPTIAIVPFKMLSPNNNYTAIADAIPAELIASLSRLRWLKVVARGSSFRFRDDLLDMTQINNALGAQYCLSGVVEIFNSQLTVGVELSDTYSQSVVWSNRISANIDDVHRVRETIVADVLTSLELRIPMHEAEKARLNSPATLDAWAHYHLGLHHMFRFRQSDTDIATDHFKRAIALDSTFARAFAGLSYVHFQNAFQKFSDNRKGEQLLARQYAEKSMELDPLDPFVNLAVGRSKWLEEDFESSLIWINRSIDLNPNYSYGLYNQSLLNSILCNGDSGQKSAAQALSLSPLDPVRSSMFAGRAINLYLEEQHDNALIWAKRAIQDIGTHPFVYALAAIVFAHTGDQQTAKRCVEDIYKLNAAFRQQDFFRRFCFVEPEKLQKARKLLTDMGLNQ